MASTLSKEERLSGRTAIQELMHGGRWEHTPHLRCCIRAGNGLEFNRIMVSVPKRNFKRAVKRNLLKRRIREAYRTQKESAAATGCDILFIYTGREPEPFGSIRSEVGTILGRLAR